MRRKPVEIAVSVVAAVVAATVASIFGVTGTIAGAAVGSAIATSLAALLSQSLARGEEAVKRTKTIPPARAAGASTRAASSHRRAAGQTSTLGHVRAPERTYVPSGIERAAATGAKRPERSSLIGSTRAKGPPGARTAGPRQPYGASTRYAGEELPTEDAGGAGGAGPAPSSRRRWRVALAASGSAVGVFAIALAIVTLVELGSGRSLSSVFGGPDAGTTVGGVFNGVTPQTPSPTTPSSPTPTQPSGPTTTAPTSPSTSVPSSTTTSSTTTTTAPGPSGVSVP